MFNHHKEPTFPDSFVTVENVGDIKIDDLAIWVSEWILGNRIPQPGANTSVSTIMPQINDMMADIPNKASLCTELYACLVAQVSNLKVAKSHKKMLGEEQAKEVENNLMLATAKLDIMYRAWQTLELTHKGASRMIGVADSEYRGAGGR